MASHSSGSISGPSQNSGSSGSSEQQLVMDIRKRKRMISNRESARRSRMRKRQHLEELSAQLGHLGAENTRLSTAIEGTVQLYLNLEAENSILRAQEAELSNWLESLNQIINSAMLNPEVNRGHVGNIGSYTMNYNNNPWTDSILATHPLVAPIDI